MKTRIAVFASLVTLGLAGTTASAKAPNVQPGEWETTVNVEMVGMPVPINIPPFVSKGCITKEDAVPRTSKEDTECTVNNQKVKGDTVTWEVACKTKEGAVINGNGSATYKGKTFDGTMDMQMQQGPQTMRMKYTMNGKHIGPCKEADKKKKQ